MNWQRKVAGMAVLALAVAPLADRGYAQAINSSAKTIALQATLTPSITVNLSGNAVNFVLTPGNATNAGSTSITATTSWAMTTGIGFVSLYAFFASSTSALSNGAGNNIPSSDFQVSDNAGAFTALTSTAPFGGANAGLRVGTTFIFLTNMSGSRTDTMNFNINLSSVPSLAPGTYTGTLTLQAQAI